MSVKIIKASPTGSTAFQLIACDKENSRYMILDDEISLSKFNKLEQQCWEKDIYYYRSLLNTLRYPSSLSINLEPITGSHPTFEDAYKELILLNQIGGV